MKIEHLANGSFLLTDESGGETLYDHNGQRISGQFPEPLFLLQEQIQAAIHEKCLCALKLQKVGAQTGVQK